MNNRNDQQLNHRILLLGIGAAKDRTLKANLLIALNRLKIILPIEEVSDLDLLLAYGITGIPALIIDEKVVFQKIVPSVDELIVVLQVLLQTETRDPLHFHNLVVPTDFSAASENAFSYAVLLAHELNASVRLIHIQDPESATLGGTLFFETKKTAPQNKDRLLNSMVRRNNKLNEKGKPAVGITKSVIQGLVPQELQRLSQESDTDLIVMGINGEKRLMPQWFEPTYLEVARRASCPVLLIPENCHFEGFKNIVYACNRGNIDEKILAQVLRFAQLFNANLHFIQLEVNGNASISVLTSLIDNKGNAFHLAAIQNPDLASSIKQYAQQQQADLLIMNAVPRHFFQELFYHNITYQMALDTHVPFLIIHGED
jgi:nucleotide-binding universal stress UspA family protein